MKFLIIGGGSMGKRRQRCLTALGHESAIYDSNPSRSQVDKIETLDVDGFFVCVPPDKHTSAVEQIEWTDRPVFVEHGIEDDGIYCDRIYPSCTMLFHPDILRLKIWLETAGKPSNIVYHQGQYLPDWHPDEKVSDYYVSKPATGASREIVPFELTWITAMFGFPAKVAANYRKTVDIPGAELIDDTYNILLDYRSFLASITIECVSKKPTRALSVVCANGEFNCDLNAGIGEQMYIDETAAFIHAAFGNGPWPNNVELDCKVMDLLQKIEQSDLEARQVRV